MCAKLRKAEAAEARGDHSAKQRWLEAYIHQMQAETGETLTAQGRTLSTPWHATLTLAIQRISKKC